MGWWFSFEMNYLSLYGLDHDTDMRRANQVSPNQSQIAPFSPFSIHHVKRTKYRIYSK